MLKCGNLCGIIKKMDKVGGKFATDTEPSPVRIISRGFVYVRENEELINGAKDVATRALIDALDDGITEWTELKNILKASISKYILTRQRKSR